MLNIGLYIDAPYVFASLVEQGRKGTSVRSLQVATLSHPTDVKRLYMENFKGKIHTGLSASELLIRPFETPLTDPNYLEEAARFQAEATSHLPAEEFFTIPWLKTEPNPKQKKKMESLLLTVPKSTLETHLKTCQELGADPDSVGLVSAALVAFLKWKAPALNDAFLVHLGASEWTCIWMENGFLKKSHCIPGGTEALLVALWEDRKRIHLQKEIGGVAKQIDLLQFKPYLNQHLAEKLQELSQQLSRALFAFHRQAGARQIVFTGQVDAFAHFPEFLMQDLQEVALPYEGPGLGMDLQKFAVSLGLAISSASPNPVQFLRGEYFPKKNWQRLGTYGLSILASSLVLSTLIWAGISRSFEHRKRHLVQQVQTALHRWESPSRSGQVEELIDDWVHTVETHNTEYPYILQAPKVTEVLEWVSRHSLFKEANIKDIRYELVKFPRIGSLKEPYLAKIELEFEVEETTQARRIHEALLKGDALVDSGKEIRWEALNDSYRATFFLKNRSLHAS